MSDEEIRGAILDALGDCYSAVWDLSQIVERTWAPMQDDETTWVVLHMDEANGGFEYSSSAGFVDYITAGETAWSRIFHISWLLPDPVGSRLKFPDRRELHLRALRGLPPLEG